MLRVFMGIIAFLFSVSIWSQPAFLVHSNKEWVDSVFNQMTLDHKIGQLLMPRGNLSHKPHNLELLKQWVKDYKIGGVVFFAADPITQANITNELQSISETPLFIGQDLEWGLGMRLDGADRFPYNTTIGAAPFDENIVFRMGQEIGRQCRRMGVHINYSPVVDVNNNPANPVINFRSFGADKEVVTKNGLAMMKGIQSQNILSTAKHFPGHGDTGVDSHFDLPIINHPIERLKDIELYPFKALIDSGVSGVMTAHLNIPALEPTPGLASTFSDAIINQLLKKDLGFQGLTFTDAMEMEGAVKNYPKGEAMVRAILAGNDVLETFSDVQVAFNALKNAVLNKTISMDVLNSKVRKILMAKAWAGLDNYSPIDTLNLRSDLNTIESDVINQTIIENSVTCLKNDLNILPIKDLNQKIAVLSLGADRETRFYEIFKKYTQADFYPLPHNSDDTFANEIINQVKNYDLVILVGHFSDIRSGQNYGLNPLNTRVIAQLSHQDNVIFCLLGNPFIISKINEIKNFKTIVLSYQQNHYTEEITPQILFGALPARGHLPVNIDENFYLGMGVHYEDLSRLSYGSPELVGIPRENLYPALDSIVTKGLDEKAYPGCVLMVAKDGKVIFEKSWGYHTYKDGGNSFKNDESPIKDGSYIYDAMDDPVISAQNNTTQSLYKTEEGAVQLADLYDMASVTKVAASGLALMLLTDQGKISMDSSFSTYVSYLKNSGIGQARMLDLTTHRAGLRPYITFWKEAVDTVATFKKAMENNPEIYDLLMKRIIEPSIFAKFFGAKPDTLIDYKATVANFPGLWENKVLTSKNRVWKKDIFSNEKTSDYSITVAKDFYINRHYIDIIKERIKNEPLSSVGKYAYSDLHFYFYPDMIKNMTGKNMDEYLDEIYKSLGCHRLCYRPINQHNLSDIVATEYDSLFRSQLLHGYVHDEGASMLGGVSGHAGLFGNAGDVLKLMQLYLQKGYYGGRQYFSKDLTEYFTSYQFPQENNRRGIIFDKKDFNPNIHNAPMLTSELGFGHSGYTGTYVWADPKYGFTYVFLSNRVYPTRENRKLIDLNIRAAIGDILIKSMSTADSTSH